MKNAADALSQPPVPLIHLFIERDEIIQLAEAEEEPDDTGGDFSEEEAVDAEVAE